MNQIYTARDDMQRDEVISYEDVEVPKNRFCDRLREEQNEYFKVTV